MKSEIIYSKLKVTDVHGNPDRWRKSSPILAVLSHTWGCQTSRNSNVVFFQFPPNLVTILRTYLDSNITTETGRLYQVTWLVLGGHGCVGKLYLVQIQLVGVLKSHLQVEFKKNQTAWPALRFLIQITFLVCCFTLNIGMPSGEPILWRNAIIFQEYYFDELKRKNWKMGIGRILRIYFKWVALISNGQVGIHFCHWKKKQLSNLCLWKVSGVLWRLGVWCDRVTIAPYLW